MSASKRILSGTIASWVQIAVAMAAQILLVPLYLSFWDAATYGLWLAVLSFSSLLSAFDLGFQEYMTYEFLKLGDRFPKKMSRLLSSGMMVAVILGLIQVVVVLLIYWLDILPMIFKDLGSSLKEKAIQAFYVLFIQSVIWLLCNTVGGLLNRVMATFGYYPRMAWWSVLTNTVLLVAPAIAVVFGADLLTAGLVMAGAKVAFDIPVWFDMLRLLKKHHIKVISPSFELGWISFRRSTNLSVTGFLENIRQQGARLIMSPLVGATGIAVFSTIRTGSNVALQGLRTIINPLMPELMTFLHKRDQERTEVAFGTLWLVTIAVIAPCLLVVQTFIPVIYSAWTRGKLSFDPWLFALLSLGVLVFALSQPGIAVVKGNNLLKPQLSISIMSAVIAVLGIIIFVPLFGIKGAGVALLLSEIAASVAFTKVAEKWLVDAGLQWPHQGFRIALSSVALTSLGVIMMIIIPNYEHLILCVSILLLVWNLYRYWLTLPQLAVIKAKAILNGFGNKN
ncbi:hypothetical protein GJU39_19805 [Pedobacter petrophilus]|uniref:Oligosaccharide flippase family protein n=1 Tax=Pedobacter petrophilus TaxID=1908241 RepID=A0A7K0G3Y6_9SPHI|nr:hypothetical protein [Pedobacter petrophilus]MRX78332.1 hypothetical protein [Pedobacter petrophilus]